MADYTAHLNRIRNQARTRQEALKKRAQKQMTAQPESEINFIEFLFILVIALINDIGDYFGLDLIAFRVVDLATAFILGLWCVFRLHQFPAARYTVTVGLELIPGVGDLLPTWTIFIIYTYLKQKGLVPKEAEKAVETAAKVRGKAH